jgi:hypothetical protein
MTEERDNTEREDECGEKDRQMEKNRGKVKTWKLKEKYAEQINRHQYPYLLTECHG